MFSDSIRAGLTALRNRRGLAGLVYLANLAAAFLLAVPLYAALDGVVGPSGFSPDLTRAFDVVLWADILGKVETTLRAMGAQLVWVALLYLVWKAVLSVGLIHALRGGGVRSFWQGVGRYGARALALGGLFLALALGWGLMLAVGAAVIGGVDPGEVATFWIGLVGLPAVGVAGFALLDLMHDYARAALVIGGERVWKAWRTGLAWPFRHAAAPGVYAVWFLLAALFLLAPSAMEGAETAGWGLFLAQQALLMGRAAVTVGWFGSEVALYERIHRDAAPLLAGTPPEALPGTA